MFNKLKKFILYPVIGSVLLAVFAFVWLSIYVTISSGSFEDRIVLIPKGSSTSKIADMLRTEGVIENESIFKVATLIYGFAGTYKAGEYRFATDMSMLDVMELLNSGKTILHKMTIVEGTRTSEIVKMVQENRFLAGEIDPQDYKEGSLLPDTYLFTYGEERAEILERMEKAMDAQIARLWEKRDDNLPYTTPREALTMASIIEKETGVKAERAKVAAVFINRLRRNMKLQSDPTTIYAIEKDKGPMKRQLLRKDWKHASPYNTYHVDGLPPGPICNPGVAAIKAALNPDKHNYIFFVANGRGGHNFSETYKEHNKNIRRYKRRLASGN